MQEKTMRLPSMEIRLTAADQVRFDQYAASLDMTKTELCREAIRYWLDHQDKKINDDRESKLESRMRKMEDRLASLMMRTTIDIGVIYQAIYYNMEDKADKAFTAFYKHAVERLKTKRKDQTEKTALTKLVDELNPTEEVTHYPDPEPSAEADNGSRLKASGE